MTCSIVERLNAARPMTTACQMHLDAIFNAEFYKSKVASLGEDPLREDADPEAAWEKISVSRKPIGLLLMDQSVIAGVGNIYR